MDAPFPVVWDRSPFVQRMLSKVFDEEGTEIISYAIGYIAVWFIVFLAFSYLLEHMKFFSATIYEFPIQPKKEPLPKEQNIIHAVSKEAIN